MNTQHDQDTITVSIPYEHGRLAASVTVPNECGYMSFVDPFDMALDIVIGKLKRAIDHN